MSTNPSLDETLEQALLSLISVVSERLPPGVEFALEISANTVGLEFFNVPTTGLVFPDDYLPKPARLAGESLGTFLRRSLEHVASLKGIAVSGSCPAGQEASGGDVPSGDSVSLLEGRLS